MQNNKTRRATRSQSRTVMSLKICLLTLSSSQCESAKNTNLYSLEEKNKNQSFVIHDLFSPTNHMHPKYSVSTKKFIFFQTNIS